MVLFSIQCIKMKMKIISLVIILISSLRISAQDLSTVGFNAREYYDLLGVNELTHMPELAIGKQTGETNIYTLQYRSPEVGLLNRWELWIRNDGVAVISIRGTIQQPVSWMANFYAAMIPATGSMQINDSTNFQYQLAADPKAAVHIGWMIGLAHIAPGMVAAIKDLAATKNTDQFIIMGHSQGGALAFLTTSYLYYLTQKGDLPSNIKWKTYCSAAPKPGNTYYAYDYDFITRNGKAYTIVNSADWVPETPNGVQTLNDYNTGSPFSNIQAILGKQKPIARWYLNGVFKKMDRSTKKAQRRLDKYLGQKMYKVVKKVLPQFKQPAYANTSVYTRAGVPIVLIPNEEYWKAFPNDPAKTFQHHLMEPYRFLVKAFYITSK
jgi:hypothetical protein